MGMNETPSANRVQIGVFGRTNAGKSSIVNAIAGQDVAVVSNVRGTTTDPVKKAMELLPLGPVVFIDTPGLDDEGELGRKRVEKSRQILNKADLAILVLDGQATRRGDLEQVELPLLKEFSAREIPYVIAVNKSEEMAQEREAEIRQIFEKYSNLLFVSAVSGKNIQKLKELLADLSPKGTESRIIGDLLSPGDVAVLVIPIDAAAPKGRLILPQQQVIRDCLEAGAVSMAVRETELPAALRALHKKPKVVITDSQAFERVDRDTPKDIYLTSFSILFSRYKGNLRQQAMGAEAISKLKDGDVVLISEGCTHHRQCGDIGTEKLPRWISEFTGKTLQFRFTSGTDFPEDLTGIALAVHCGGCTLNEREMQCRLRLAMRQGVPMTNYGTAIAKMHGILERSLEMFQETD